jgi:ariadne-1
LSLSPLGADVKPSDLEKAVEDLSELLELPIESQDIPALRQKITDKTVSDMLQYGLLLLNRSSGLCIETK